MRIAVCVAVLRGQQGLDLLDSLRGQIEIGLVPS